MGAGTSRRNSPPKHAIANGFAFGSIPNKIQIAGPEGLLEDLPILEELDGCPVCFPYPNSSLCTRVCIQEVVADEYPRALFLFIEVDQNHTGAVLNRNQAELVLCVS